MQKYALNRILAVIVLAALALAALPGGPAQAATQSIYADALATSWQDWSYTTHDLQASSPVHAGSKSISVTYGAWQGLYLHHPGLSTLGFTKLSFFIHGGSAGGQKLQVSVYNATGTKGPAFNVPAPAANAWAQVQIPLSTLGVANTTITGIDWQDLSGGAQPTLYIDDIALADDASPDGPALSAGDVLPRAVVADGATFATVRVHVTDPQGAADIASVSVDASALGRGTVALRDDGRSNDGAAGDGTYGAAFTVASGTPAGEVALLATARDKAAHSASLALGAFVVLARAGGRVPTGLPQRIGWGTNEWSETPGQDWQVNSGVPWDYDYQYITWGWEGWGPNFVSRFVNQAWSKNYVPVVSVYMILGVPPSTGEGGVPYAAKLQNATTVSDYLASVARAAAQAKGAKPVIFHIEPDFYGFMQQLSNNSANRPAGVRPDDPTSYPVAVNVAGYPNTLAGFGKRIVDVIHTTAPNVLVAPHASMWATNNDANNVTAAQAQSMAQHTATFIGAMGGAQSDLLFVEWSDRDSGCTDLPQCQPQRSWWDDTDRNVPRPTRAILWENALSVASGKRLILWQVPAGNMAQNNTCDHYQDNRAAYLFNHPRDMVDAGVTAVLFGGGASCMTGASTDGGFIAGQGAIEYAVPAAPTGLGVASVAGSVVSLYWGESTLPDRAGYRIRYQPQGGGAAATYDVGRANATRIVLPSAGTWSISIATIDAMGKVGPFSAAVPATTTANARQVFLPLVR